MPAQRSNTHYRIVHGTMSKYSSSEFKNDIFFGDDNGEIRPNGNVLNVAKAAYNGGNISSSVYPLFFTGLTADCHNVFGTFTITCQNYGSDYPEIILVQFYLYASGSEQPVFYNFKASSFGGTVYSKITAYADASNNYYFFLNSPTSVGNTTYTANTFFFERRLWNTSSTADKIKAAGNLTISSSDGTVPSTAKWNSTINILQMATTSRVSTIEQNLEWQEI